MTGLTARQEQTLRHAIEPSLQMMEQQIELLQRISAQIDSLVQCVTNRDDVPPEGTTAYAELRKRVFDNLM